MYASVECQLLVQGKERQKDCKPKRTASSKSVASKQMESDDTDIQMIIVVIKQARENTFGYSVRREWPSDDIIQMTSSLMMHAWKRCTSGAEFYPRFHGIFCFMKLASQDCIFVYVESWNARLL